MKELIYKGTIAFILVCGLVSAEARGLEIEKKKTITKSYTVKDFVSFKVKNSFGKVHVTNSKDNSLTVVADIIVKRKNEEKAQELLDKIKIKISESTNEIVFETDFEGKMTNTNNETFEVNYTISLPSVNPMIVHNSFGDVYVGDRNGKNEIKLAYCDFRIEQLTGNSDIKMSFSDGVMKQMKEGELEIKYSTVSIESLGNIKLEEGFSHLNIERAETIDMVSKYGDLKIGSVNGIKGNVGFSGLSIENVVVELDLDASYTGLTINKVSKDFKLLNITGKFGAIKIGLEGNVSASFDIETKFCGVTFPNNGVNLNYQVKGDISSVYRGTMGSGKGGLINISSSYGDVKFYY